MNVESVMTQIKVQLYQSMPFLNQIILTLDDEQGEDPSIEVSNSQPSQVIYEKESNIKLDYSELEEGNYYKYLLIKH